LLIHRYSFTADARDSVGSADGALAGGAAISGGEVVLNGLGAYVDLPNGILSGLDSITIEVWLTDHNSGSWSRIFDLGNSSGGEGVAGSGTQYLFLTPQSGSGTLRGAITVSGAGAGEQLLEWPGTRLPADVRKHVVWTTDGAAQAGRLYVDGVLVAENNGMTVRPSDLGVTLNNWIGRSQFSADAFLNAEITEFRIYSSALTAAEVQESWGLGPDTNTFHGPVSLVVHPRSQTVAESSPATFTAAYCGSRPVTAQWYRNGAAIPAATNSTLTIPTATLADQGAVYRITLTNTFAGTTYTASSSNAVLTVTADTTPPALVRADSLFPNEVRVTFSEGLASGAALNVAHYVITNASGSLPVTGARFDTTSSNVVLTTGTQTLGARYTLTVNHVTDLSATANPIAPDSQASFVTTEYLAVDVGDPAVAGTLAVVADGFDLAAGGGNVGGTSDQFLFVQRTRTNDFDFEVRVASLTCASAWTRAGLMARDGLATNALFAASMATPGPAGCHFQSRTSVGGAATMAGSFPANYPDTWLRLRRVGNVFEGLASLDGETWELLGSATIAMSATVQVGFVLTAGAPTGSGAAQFRDAANGSGATVTSLAFPFEPPGPSSRRTALVISEIMYHAGHLERPG